MKGLPTTWAQVCKIKGIDRAIPDVSNFPEEMREYMINAYMHPIIVEVLNADHKPVYTPWIPDYTDYSQTKYEIWWDVKATADKPAGVGLAYFDYDGQCTHSYCGSRFCFRDVPRAKHFAQYFLPVVNKHYLI